MYYLYPDYYKKFHCIADKCIDTCCAEWQIVIDDESLEKYRNYKGDYQQTLCQNIDWEEGVFGHNKRGKCAFLRDDDLCDMYIHMGEDSLCTTCREYPRHTEEFENLREITLSLSCPEVAKIVMNTTEPITFVTKEDETDECYEEFDYFLFSELEDVREEMIRIIQDRNVNLRDRIDKILQTAYDNGLGLRGHTLLWHNQTPAWFFGIDYDADEDAVDEDTMDARIDFYVSTVMDHVMQKEKEIAGETGKIVYAWDVVNEYLHRGRAWSLNWTSVYGDMKGTPSYVKRAFERAYEMLEKYDATDKVTLFYNDYDTYFEVEDLLALVNFINEGEKAKICSGIGMQSHVDIKRPTIEEYGAALEKFMAAGYEVQITELDFTINFDTDGTDKKDPSYDYENEGETIEEQAAFVKDFMEMVIAKQKNRDKTVSPKGITGLTIWGLYDGISWRGKSQPLLFGTSIDDPKPAFQAFLEASRTK